MRYGACNAEVSAKVPADEKVEECDPMPLRSQAFVAVVTEKSCGVESSLRNRISERRRTLFHDGRSAEVQR